MKSYRNFINESIKPILKYMAFDWDDNLLFMPTKINMQENVDGEWIETPVSTEKFAKIRNDEGWRYSEEKFPFANFRDFDPKIFYNDSMKAIKKGAFGPSWNAFIECLTSGTIFSIITARGHEPKTIKEVVKYIIKKILTKEQKNEMAANLMGFTSLFNDNDIMIQRNFDDLVDKYLKHCEFVGVSSESFMNKHEQFRGEFGSSNPEGAKKQALSDFLEKLDKWSKKVGGIAKLGFSDDDVKTINHVEQHFNEIDDKYDIDLFVYNTSDPDNVIKTEV